MNERMRRGLLGTLVIALAAVPAASAGLGLKLALDPCPTLVADVDADGSVRLRFDALLQVATLVRSGTDGTIETDLGAGTSSHVDASVEAGATYAYALSMAGRVCAAATVTVGQDADTDGGASSGADATADSGADGTADVTADTGVDAQADVQADAHADVQSHASHEASVCPSLAATARGDGTVQLHLDGLVQEATLLRATGSGPAEPIATLEAGQEVVTDVDVDAGAAYAYSVMIDGHVCAQIEVTAVPVFTTALAGVAAVGLSVLGYALTRRW